MVLVMPFLNKINDDDNDDDLFIYLNIYHKRYCYSNWLT